MTPKEQMEWEETVYQLWDTMVGKEVSVTCQFSQGKVYGILRKETVDWDCPFKGRDIYCVMDRDSQDQILTVGDIVSVV